MSMTRFRGNHALRPEELRHLQEGAQLAAALRHRARFVDYREQRIGPDTLLAWKDAGRRLGR
jgi:hypothetical protein